MKKGQIFQNSQSNRIPQPSIINSATGMGNMSGSRGHPSNDQENIGYQSQTIVPGGFKGDSKRMQQSDMSLHNPMIIDKKFSNQV